MEKAVKCDASENCMTTAQLFLGFLNYFANTFDYEKSAISVRTGGIIPIAEVKYKLLTGARNDPRMWNYLCIEGL
jgi:DNA polymerase sigma